MSEIFILYVIFKYFWKERVKNVFYFIDINDMFLYEKNNFIECLDVYVLLKELYIFVN